LLVILQQFYFTDMLYSLMYVLALREVWNVLQIK